ncbi:MAG: alginate export family protein [Acidobacteria bacterium]|nr:alginate export family protein [Acidobacteriota bacterium]
MKKFLYMFLLVAAVASAFSFVVAQTDDPGEKKFVLHGEIRQRADYEDNLTDFTSDLDDSFLMFPYRARIAAEGHFTKNVTGYVEFQAFGVWGDAPPIKGFQFGPVGADVNSPIPFPVNSAILQNTNSGQDFGNDVELYQGYIGLNEIAGSQFSLILGRQEIVKGTEMLLGDNDFYNGVSHDAAMGTWQAKNFALDVWWSRPLQTPAAITSSPGGTVPDHQSINFYGAWLNWNRYDNGVTWAAYILDYDDGLSTGLPDAVRSQFVTLGARTDREISGKNGIYWNAEFAYQSGDYNNGPNLQDTGSIKATGWEGTLGFNLYGSYDHKFQILYDVASGDDDFTNDDAENFNPLFQDSHDRYGFTDIFVFSNLTVWGLGYHAIVSDTQSWGVDYFNQSLSEDIVGGPANGENALGQEIDGWWKMQYTANTQVMVGAAWFDPGDAIDADNSASGLSTDAGIRLLAQVRLRW